MGCDFPGVTFGVRCGLSRTSARTSLCGMPSGGYEGTAKVPPRKHSQSQINPLVYLLHSYSEFLKELSRSACGAQHCLWQGAFDGELWGWMQVFDPRGPARRCWVARTIPSISPLSPTVLSGTVRVAALFIWSFLGWGEGVEGIIFSSL